MIKRTENSKQNLEVTFLEDRLQRLELVKVDLAELFVLVHHGHSLPRLHLNGHDLRGDGAALQIIHNFNKY